MQAAAAIAAAVMLATAAATVLMLRGLPAAGRQEGGAETPAVAAAVPEGA